MKRVFVLTAFLLVFALALPASSATWRTYGAVRSDRGAPAILGGTAKSTTDIQLGLYSYSKGRYIQWDADFTCWRGSNYTSRSKSGKKWVPANTWRYITIRDASSQSDECDVGGFAYPANISDTGSIRLAIRVK
jgi:hypothetical protein